MSYFIVPSVSYQTQQKLKGSRPGKGKPKKGKGAKGGKDNKTETASLHSSSTDSTNVSSGNKRAQDAKSEDVISSVSGAESNQSSDSRADPDLSASIAFKYSKTADSPSAFQPPRTIEEDEGNDLEPPSDNANSTRKSSAWSNYSLGSSASANSNYRRNSSMTSSNSHSPQGHKHRFGRKFSSSFLGAEKPTNATEVSETIPIDSTRSQNDTRSSPKIEPFNTVTDLEILNSQASMKKHLFSPVFQIFRYNNFLDILSSHHKNDAINFAGVRHHSLVRFLIRHKNANYNNGDIDTSNLDVRYYESWLAYELLFSRTFLRHIIRRSVEYSKFGNDFHVPEELVQVNFTNYVRYLLNLPERTADSKNAEEYDDITETHYKYKDVFRKISEGIFNIKKERGEEIAKESKGGIVNILLQAITKVSYEYILLEKYHIQILSKISNNSLISIQNTRKLFELYIQNITENNNDSVKVLVYNIWFSAQYSWYMAITLPFLRIYETNVNSEDPDLLCDEERYTEHEKRVSKVSLKEHDDELHDLFFSKLQLSSFDQFQSKSLENLSDLHRSLDQKSSKMNAYTKYNNQPMNFEYCTQSLSAIEEGTFNLIQNRDISIQTREKNRRTIMRQFHRILKKDGVLEITCFVSCPKLWKDWLDQNQSSFSDWNVMMNPSIESFPFPKNVIATLSELNEIFGEGNVKFNVSTLAASEISSFLTKHIALQLYESSAHLSELFSGIEESSGVDFNEEDSLIHCHIQATK